MKKYFSIPADFKLDTIDQLHELNETYNDSKVIETYGQATSVPLVNSGRVTDTLPKVDLKDLEKYVMYLRRKGMQFNYTLNPACMGNAEFTKEGTKELIRFLRTLNGIGVEALTLTSPQLIELVQATNLGFKIKASAICEITSPSKSLFYKNKNIDRIVVDPDITRDFDTLRRVCKVFGSGVEVIVNNVCYKNCTYKMFHYNHEAHCTPQNTSQLVRDFYLCRCSMQKANDFKNSIKLNWIRPEDLIYYVNTGISYFKIQGRQNILHGDIIKTLKHYFSEDFDGNLFDLITIFAPYNSFQPYVDNKKLDGFVKMFYDKPDFCKDICHSCGYCESYAKKSMNSNEVKELNEKALRFFGEMDTYTKMVNRYLEEDV
ncbi:U32 family peptidase [Anaerosporobacter faecicola]|uniref:U32 family peptidase n=1 Tax=Anaerosporobacter faecicola TaxID=2718714 RepID=UPI00143BF4A7|nr:U32 family peptidase [Anaerosporobacter faecicola]